MIDLTKDKFCVWGFRNGYDTFNHIQEGFYRALVHLGKKVMWLDGASILDGIDFSDTFFITQNDIVAREIHRLPLREDCFYAVHNNIQQHRDRFERLDVLPFGVQLAGMPDWDDTVKSVNLVWATDLLPGEIEGFKPIRQEDVFNRTSLQLNYVGSIYDVNRMEIKRLKLACEETGVRFEQYNGGIPLSQHVQLIRQSLMAPAIIGAGHPTGYIPCRIFKNISYGQPGVTNSRYVNEFFDGQLIFNPDPYEMFYLADAELPHVTWLQQRDLMTFVAEKHTYLNRIETLLRGANRILEINHDRFNYNSAV